jgi:hypothetical protein
LLSVLFFFFFFFSSLFIRDPHHNTPKNREKKINNKKTKKNYCRTQRVSVATAKLCVEREPPRALAVAHCEHVGVGECGGHAAARGIGTGVRAAKGHDLLQLCHSAGLQRAKS